MLPERDLVADALQGVAARGRRQVEVAHYTSLATLPYLFPAGSGRWASLWASHVLCLNDRAEVTEGLRVLLGVAERDYGRGDLRFRTVEQLLRGMPGDGIEPCSVSFSAATDELGQWRGYAADGYGCAVVSTAGSLTPCGDLAGFVVYRDKQQQAFAAAVLGGLPRGAGIEAISRAAILAACFIKHHGFEQEAEFRLIRLAAPSSLRYRPAGQRVVPYVDLLAPSVASPTLRRVVLGPGWQLGGLTQVERQRHHVALSVARLLQTAEVAAPVEASAIPYDPR